MKRYLALLILSAAVIFVVTQMLWLPVMLSPVLLIIFAPTAILGLLRLKYGRRRW